LLFETKAHGSESSIKDDFLLNLFNVVYHVKFGIYSAGCGTLRFRCEPADHLPLPHFLPCVSLTAARILSPVHRSPWRRAGSYTFGQRAIFSPVRARQPQRSQQTLNLRPSIGHPVYDRSRRRMPTIRDAQRTAPSASKTEPCIQITAAVPIGRLSITQLL